MKLDEILQHFESVKEIGQKQYKANCPNCSDTKQHLYITESGDKILLDCKKGCTFADIAAAANLKKADFFTNHKRQKWLLLREHVYTDENSKPAAKKLVYDIGGGKKMATWQRFENGRYINKLNNYKPLPYHAHNIGKSDNVYIAEGEKDVETLEKMGFIATCSPNGAGEVWKKTHNNFFTNKNIVILADNDDAGRKHANNTAIALCKTASNIKVIHSENIYPQLKEKGDISDIVAACGIVRAKEMLDSAVNKAQTFAYNESESAAPKRQFPSYFVPSKQDVNTGEIIYKVSCPLLAEHIRQNSKYIFVNDGNCGYTRRYWYENGVYIQKSDDEIKGKIKAYITEFDKSILKMRDVDEAFKDLATDCNFVSEAELNGDENIINFQNGLLYLDTMELKPHSADIVSTIQIPCNYNESATKSPMFDKFLYDLCGGNVEKERFLLEFVAACISNIKGYRFKKALIMYGAGDTGKSQLKSLAEKIIGAAHISPCDLPALEERFGTSNLYGKRLIGAADMGFVTVKELKVFKQITGGDEICIERKGKDIFSYKYQGFVWFCTNDLPKFGGDRGDWVYERIIPFQCNNVIPKDKQDKHLLDKMFAEREAIINRLIAALKKVIANGYCFDIPKECLEIREQYKTVNSPVRTFYNECCIDRTDYKDCCTTSVVYNVFKEWCKDNNSNRYTPSVREFRSELAQILADGDVDSIVRKHNGYRYFTFTLDYSVKEEYKHKYGSDFASLF